MYWLRDEVGHGGDDFFDNRIDVDDTHLEVIIPYLVSFRDHWLGEMPDLHIQITMTPEDLVGPQQLAVQLFDAATYRRWVVLHSGDALPGMILSMCEALEPLMRDAIEEVREREYQEVLEYADTSLVPLPAFDLFRVRRHQTMDAYLHELSEDFLRATMIFVEGALESPLVDAAFTYNDNTGHYSLNATVEDQKTDLRWSISSKGKHGPSLGAYGLDALKRMIWPEIDDEHRITDDFPFEGHPS